MDEILIYEVPKTNQQWLLFNLMTQAKTGLRHRILSSRDECPEVPMSLHLVTPHMSIQTTNPIVQNKSHVGHTALPRHTADMWNRKDTRNVSLHL